MPTKRTYADLGDACATAHGLDIVGDRWNLVVVRELLLGPRRFADLLSAVIGISPGVLTARLRELQDAGVVEQVTLDDLARTRAYRVTPWGAGLEDVMRALGRWAHGSPSFPVPGTGMTPDAVIVAMRTMVPTEGVRADRPLTATWELHDERRPAAGVRRYRLLWEGRCFDLAEGSLESPDVTVRGDSTAWTGAVFLGVPLDELERSGALAVEGDRDALARVVAVFAPAAGELSPGARVVGGRSAQTATSTPGARPSPTARPRS